MTMWPEKSVPGENLKQLVGRHHAKWVVSSRAKLRAAAVASQLYVVDSSECGEQHGTEAAWCRSGIKHDAVDVTWAHSAWEKKTWKRSGSVAHMPG
jgi:predicted amidohydrolase